MAANIKIASDFIAMERGGLAKAFGKLTDSFRSCMVEEYMKSYLSHSGSDAVILMKKEAENVVLKTADMEVRSDGIFLRYKNQNSDTRWVSASDDNVDKAENGIGDGEYYYSTPVDLEIGANVEIGIYSEIEDEVGDMDPDGIVEILTEFRDDIVTFHKVDSDTGVPSNESVSFSVMSELDEALADLNSILSEHVFDC